jgi:DNA-binding transcriptional LysR family regulator
MRWDDLRFLLAVVRTGSFSAASTEIGVSHTTVARRVAGLERHLGAKLLQRTPEGFTPTRAGESIMALCERIEGSMIEVERQAAGTDRAEAGLVRVTATETFATRFVIPAMQELRRRHPEIEIELIPDHRRLDLTRRQADVALRNLKPREPSLKYRRLATFGLALYASREYWKRHPKPRPGNGLAGHDLVAWTYMLPAAQSQFLGESTAGARIAFRSNSTSALVGAAAHGFGIGLLPCYLADDDPRLVRLWPEMAPQMQPLWVIHHEDLSRAARIRLVIAVIVETFRRNQKLLRGVSAPGKFIPPGGARPLGAGS